MGLLDDAIKEHLELKRRRGADAGEISRLESEALGPVRRSADGVPDLSDTVVPDPPAADTPDAPAPAPWEDEQTAGHSALPDTSTHEPPPIPPASAAAPSTPAYEPPPVPRAPAYEPPPVPPSPAPTPPTPAYEPPSVSPAPPYEPPPPAREAWMTEPDPEPKPEAEPEPEPEPTGLLSRLRVGRRHKPEPEARHPAAFESAPVPETPAYEPPPQPSYEPPPPPVEHEPDIVPADDEPDVEELLEETPEFLEETPEHDRLWFEQRPPRDFDFDG
jgi:hypothetical protein